VTFTIENKRFDGLNGALEDILAKGLFPTTYATDHATAPELHWHNEEVLVYLVQGKAYFTDADGMDHRLEAGGLITVPARTLHAEGNINEPVVMLIGLKEALTADQYLLKHYPAKPHG
jgi:gentisate 1,2-dioxygenase